jgi:hypothetical protein
VMLEIVERAEVATPAPSAPVGVTDSV